MTPNEFLTALSGYNNDNVLNYASLPIVRGGWEVWLQCEIARHFIQFAAPVRYFIRELNYPNRLTRCDFFTAFLDDTDPTFIELKCIRPLVHGGLNQAKIIAQAEFLGDIDKIRLEKTHNPNINGIAVLATYGTFNCDEIANLVTELTNRNVVLASVLHYSNHFVGDIGTMGGGMENGLYIIAASS